MCYISHPFHLPLSEHPNNICEAYTSQSPSLRSIKMNGVSLVPPQSSCLAQVMNFTRELVGIVVKVFAEGVSEYKT
jgi:hypothetical protein